MSDEYGMSRLHRFTKKLADELFDAAVEAGLRRKHDKEGAKNEKNLESTEQKTCK
jgi:hypothetical protein